MESEVVVLRFHRLAMIMVTDCLAEKGTTPNAMHVQNTDRPVLFTRQ
jgi:hypothetical protein